MRGSRREREDIPCVDFLWKRLMMRKTIVEREENNLFKFNRG